MIDTLLALALALAPAPDSIWLEGATSACRGHVEKSDRNAVVVRIARADVESAERTDDSAWPDRITLRGSKTPVAAAVVREDADTLTVRFPAAAIAKIERDAPESESEPPAPQRKPEPPPAPATASRAPKGEDESADADAGAIAGRIVRAGKPLGRCRVRAVRLVEEKDFLGLSSALRPVRGEEPRESVTDADGKFRIDGLPPGFFKLYFCVEGDKNWTRRLREEPDAEVKAGLVVRLKDVDLSRRPL